MVAIQHAIPQLETVMPFADKLANLRKEKGLTQLALAELVQLHQAQIHRYESGGSEPSMSALKRLALALGVTSDELIFDEAERGPDDDLRLQFEAISSFDPDEKRTAKEVLEGLILKHEARRWAASE